MIRGTPPELTREELLALVAAQAAQIEALLAENAALRVQNAALLEITGRLEARIAELERRLGLNSSNSSKPPSATG